MELSDLLYGHEAIKFPRPNEATRSGISHTTASTAIKRTAVNLKQACFSSDYKKIAIEVGYCLNDKNSNTDSQVADKFKDRTVISVTD